MTSVTDPSQAPLVVTDPPYAVMGRTDKPFLARIVMEWTGLHNPPMHVEHWVEVGILTCLQHCDPVLIEITKLSVGKANRPVLGDEQMIDVELDRNTTLLPYRNDMWLIDWNDNMEKKRDKTRKAGTRGTIVDEPGMYIADALRNYLSHLLSDHVRLLKTLLPRFPATMKGESYLFVELVHYSDASIDVKSRPPHHLPYTLATSPAHFRTLVSGRRKAIEVREFSAINQGHQITICLSARPGTGTL